MGLDEIFRYRIARAFDAGAGDLPENWNRAGRVAHYLQDMAVPAHVVPVFHGLWIHDSSCGKCESAWFSGFGRYVGGSESFGTEADVPTHEYRKLFAGRYQGGTRNRALGPCISDSSRG